MRLCCPRPGHPIAGLAPDPGHPAPVSSAHRPRLYPGGSDALSIPQAMAHAHNPGLRLELLGDRQGNAMGTLSHWPHPSGSNH